MSKNNPPNDIPSVLKKQVNWQNLYFFQKSDVLYQMTYVFCDKYIHLFKDRTRDQVIQAARSCKQNIVEGLADGITSTEMQLKLLNVARSSLQEVRQDFEDYLKSRYLKFWGLPPKHKESEMHSIPDSYYDRNTARYDAMLDFCRQHNTLEEYEPFIKNWNDEELCNYAITICHMIDRMMMSFLGKLDAEFVTEGGIKERMYKARTGYRNQQDERLKQLEADFPILEQQLAEAKAEATKYKAAYEDIKQRALKSYYNQQEEIKALKEKLSKMEERMQTHHN